MKSVSLTLPVNESDIRALVVGDLVLISGVIYTGRDAVHKHLYDGHSIPVSLQNTAIYHCGPVVVPVPLSDDAPVGWSVRAAGPTTSAREEPYQANVIQNHKLRMVIGKGGMGAKTLAACQEFGCVYVHAVGGAAQVLAECVVKVLGVSMLEEFGSPEAVWKLEVKDFPGIVTMDANGNSLHAGITAHSQQMLSKLIG